MYKTLSVEQNENFTSTDLFKELKESCQMIGVTDIFGEWEKFSNLTRDTDHMFELNFSVLAEYIKQKKSVSFGKRVERIWNYHQIEMSGLGAVEPVAKLLYNPVSWETMIIMAGGISFPEKEEWDRVFDLLVTMGYAEQAEEIKLKTVFSLSEGEQYFKELKKEINNDIAEEIRVLTNYVKHLMNDIYKKTVRI